jgi:prevent-host-death family protein
MRWQVQDAKQRFSELLRTAHADGPQVVTRHGEEIAVVIDIADYLRSGPDFDDLDLARTAERPRSIDWANGA